MRVGGRQEPGHEGPWQGFELLLARKCPLSSEPPFSDCKMGFPGVLRVLMRFKEKSVVGLARGLACGGAGACDWRLRGR